MPYEEWMDEAKCAAPDVDPDIFFSTDQIDTERAKTICRECPMRMQCAAYALGNREREGLWAGMDMNTLRQEARRIGVNAPRARRYA
jgi:WhiB family redox-sensing transcriptional regulator